MKISQWEFNEWKSVVNGNSMNKKTSQIVMANDSDIIIPLQNHKKFVVID